MSGAWLTVALVLLAGVLFGGCDTGGDEKTLEQQPPDKPKSPALDALPTPPGGAGGVKPVKVAGGFKQPTYAIGVPGKPSLLLVVERRGTIWAVRDGRRLRRPFLDLRPRVTQRAGEQGLLSVAFAPDYGRSGLLYVSYSDNGDDISIAEYRRSPGSTTRADPGSARLVLRVPHPLKPTRADGERVKEDLRVHYGGQLAFGPDGMLYAGTGDGGGQGDPHDRAQNLRLLAGKLLRIDPRGRAEGSYSIPGDNPFVRHKFARPEIFAYGLRNPYRFSFDRKSGALVIGDVGQHTVEEIDYLPVDEAAGANFGWSCFEGTTRFKDCEAPGHVPPVIELPSSGTGRCASITGGRVVRRPALAALHGRYLYADFCLGMLRSAVMEGGEARDDRELGLTIPWPTSFERDARGRIYVPSYFRGTVYRLVPQ